MKARYFVCLVLVGLGAYACSSSDSEPPTTGGTTPGGTTPAPTTTVPTGTGSSASSSGSTSSGSIPTQTTIGTTGGSVTATGVTLTVPAAALPTDTAITVSSDATAVPVDYTGLSPLYTFGPDGTVFDKPVTIAFTLANMGTEPTVYWSNQAGGYDELATTITATGVTASISHFSHGFVAEKHKKNTDDAGSSGSTSGGIDAGSSGDDAGTTTDAGGASDAGVNGIVVRVDNIATTFGTNAVVSVGNGMTIMADDNATTTHWSIKVTGMTTVPQQVCQLNGNPTMTYTHFTSGTVDAVYSSKIGNSSCTLLVSHTPAATGEHAQGDIISATLGEQSGPTAPASHSFSGGTFDILY